MNPKVVGLIPILGRIFLCPCVSHFDNRGIWPDGYYDEMQHLITKPTIIGQLYA